MTPTSDDPQPVAPPSSPPPARRGGIGIKLQVALVLIAFAAGVVAMAAYFNQTGSAGSHHSPAPSAPVNAALDPVTMAPPAPATSPVARPLAALPADAAAARVAELEQRLARLAVATQTASDYANRAEAMMTAFAARRALDAGAPLGYLEAQLRVLFGEGQPKAVATIINAAREPLTVPMLRRRLEGLRVAALRGDPRASWWDGLMHGFTRLAVVRSVDAPAPEPELRLAEARLAVESGQMDEAIRQISALPVRPEITVWLEQARRYNEARRALDVIEAAAVIEPRVAATAGSAPAPASLPLMPSG